MLYLYCRGDSTDVVFEKSVFGISIGISAIVFRISFLL